MDFSPQPKDLHVAATLLVTHRPGAKRLDNHPLLVYAPEQHKHCEVCIEDRGVPVSTICMEHALNPDIEANAAKFRTTVEHIRQALDYAQGVLRQ